MKEKIQMLKDLMDRAEQFAKTNIQLYRLKAIDKVTDIFSSVASGLIIIITLTFLLIILSIGTAFWLGEVLGKVYYGFFAVAGAYAFLAILMVLFRRSILEVFFNNYIVNQIFKEKKHAPN
ncbi:hypothetical protein [Flavobacterium sp.]|uniref:hypothetical protein n=1 Tax=Flavobacterium sp. TaxID=239 RepID=UPI0011FD7189|nr:hypothetical protein [Flavobacterium sp.]RZJ71041.1 MAG: hypothetical protein EOO49_11335 [Flavobacterium sp.]